MREVTGVLVKQGRKRTETHRGAKRTQGRHAIRNEEPPKRPHFLNSGNRKAESQREQRYEMVIRKKEGKSDKWQVKSARRVSHEK